MSDDLLAEFEVLGEAKPAGSKRGFQHPHTGRIMIVDASGKAGKTWRQDVKAAAAEHFPEPFTGAIAMTILFFRARPKGHYGSGRNAEVLKNSAPAFPTTRPDCDKLSRGCLDALTGIAWRDDSQVVTKTVAKRYARSDRTVIRIFRADTEDVSDLTESRCVGSVPQTP